MRLQPLGAVNRQQTYGVGVDGGWGLQPASLEGAHKRVRRGVTATIELQRRTQDRTQIGQHRASGSGRRGGRKTRQHIGIVINRLQGVVWRKCINPVFEFDQTGP